MSNLTSFRYSDVGIIQEATKKCDFTNLPDDKTNGRARNNLDAYLNLSFNFTQLPDVHVQKQDRSRNWPS